MKTTPSSKTFSIFAVLRALERHKLLLVLPVLVATPAAYFYAHQLPDRFRARALVAADQLHAGVLTGRAAPVVNVQEQLRDIRETVLSPAMLEAVIREFSLYDLAKIEDVAPAIAAMTSRIQIQVEGPDAFYIGFEGDRKEQVMQVANRLAGGFIGQMGDLRGQRVEHQDHFLDGEVNRLRRQLNQQQDSLTAYRQTVARELPEFLTANLKQLDNLQQQIQAKTDKITEAEARRAALTEEVKALEKARVLEDEPAALTPMEINIADLRSKLKQLRAKYTPEYPEIKRAQKELQDLEASATPAKAVRRQPSQIQLQYLTLQAELKSIDPRLASYRQERDGLTAQMSEYERKVDSSPGYESTLSSRSRDLAVTRANYETLLAKQQDAKLSQRAEQTDAGYSPVFRIAEPAPLPSAPSSPRRVLIVMLGLLAGLGAGIGAVFLAEQMNDTFSTSEEFESAHDLPVLASVPSIPAVRKGAAGNRAKSQGADAAGLMAHVERHALPMLNDPQSLASQQYGILALKVSRWMEHNGGRVVAVTSSAGEEGKSVTALNLSLALAASLEEPVLLVDCDMRLPQVHQRLGLKNEQGLSDLLEQPESDFHTYISKVGKLDVITGGAPAVNPVGLLASRRARGLFERLRQEYRLVVLDSPPIVPIADTHILAGLSDAVVLVVRARKTRPALFQRAVESLDAPNVIGVVLNDVEYADTPYAYAYRYYQKHYLGRG